MSRKILFRAKSIDNGQWVYGYYSCDSGRYHFIKSIDDYYDYRVDPTTVGQFIGAVDKNGIKIFEGDILCPILSKPYYIFWDGEKAGFVLKNNQCYCSIFYPHNSSEDTIIGNIHDNPDLLK